MPGSWDERMIKVVDVQNECALAILVFPDGQVRIANPMNQTRHWVAQVLHKLAAYFPLEDEETEGDSDAPPEMPGV